MSSPTKESAAGEMMKPELGKEEQQSDIFGDIDKRLSFLLERANKLEHTLNQLHENQHYGDGQDLDMELSEEVENKNAIEPDIDIIELDDLNPYTIKNGEADDNVSADNLETVNLDLHDN
ncbi:GH16800 [Drosophila grimshawi]|uniref:GH16800 n=1 Tax=Drosophila grimshawi TaxID=7222 RepID=B4IWS9_DROGR|nr:GH16800 [Drosophila grimshawi]